MQLNFVVIALLCGAGAFWMSALGEPMLASKTLPLEKRARWQVRPCKVMVKSDQQASCAVQPSPGS